MSTLLHNAKKKLYQLYQENNEPSKIRNQSHLDGFLQATEMRDFSQRHRLH